MSLKSLLAVGESFSGTGSKPYEVKKQKQIPIFATTADVSSETALDEPKEELVAAGGGDDAQMTLEAREERVRLKPERSRIEQEPEERRPFLKRWSKPTLRKLTQEEMSLEQVRVVRNDLSDADLELAPRRAARSAAQTEFNPFAPRPIAAIGRPTHEKLGMGTRVARWFRFLKKPRS
ncbi:MAG TPA: hypothetical protein VI282_08100 [Verrucomicrobiae bacterium]|jgi:hypothetical protein